MPVCMVMRAPLSSSQCQMCRLGKTDFAGITTSLQPTLLSTQALLKETLGHSKAPQSSDGKKCKGIKYYQATQAAKKTCGTEEAELEMQSLNHRKF